MLCPEVWDFPPPKVMSSCKHYDKLEPVEKTIKMNNFYKSLVITCPDELQTPSFIEDVVTTDTDYYIISDCPLTEFLELDFIENFVKSGKLYCVTANRNCIVENCAAITPDGILTIHLLEFIFQTTGLEGKKRLHNYYESNIDLKNLRHVGKLKQCLEKLEAFDFYISWEPNQEDICPSSIAKYFYDRNIKVTLHSLVLKKVTPTVTEIPSPKDVDTEEMTEWIGMLALGGDLAPTETFISTYSQPDSEFSIKSNRISILIAKGYITPVLVHSICEKISKYVTSRELDNYWAAVSVQSQEDSLWQWCPSSPRMFQAQNSSCNIFFTHDQYTIYSVGQLKYS